MTCSLSKNHKYFSTLKATKAEKNEAADVCSNFTKKFPIYFPEWNITRKMHLLGFVIPKIIRNDKSDNILVRLDLEIKIEPLLLSCTAAAAAATAAAALC